MNGSANQYASTLNLPGKTWPIKEDVQAREKGVLSFWEHKRVYHLATTERKATAKPFFLHDGPPYANGEIHVGHALNKILKDFIIKSKWLSGYYAPFIPGWDCHGLPIEIKLEKELGTKSVPGIQFRDRCRQYAQSQIDLQKPEFQRLGVLADWDRLYTTMDPKVQAQAIRVFASLYQAGWVSKGFLPVFWCTDCQSALSLAELEYAEVEHDAVYVTFTLLKSDFLEASLGRDGMASTALLVWTTTVWTLPANVAVAIHPQMEYQVISAPGAPDRFVVEQGRVEAICKAKGWAGVQVHLSFPGQMLLDDRVCHPLLAKEVPVVASSHVVAGTGTGLVHIAPAHGPEDFELAKRYGLPCQTPVGGDGKFCQEDPLVPGMPLAQAGLALLELLETNGTLFLHEPHVHSYPLCWRHKTPLIYYATPQWFVKLRASPSGEEGPCLAQHAMAASLEVKWLPEWGGDRMAQALQSRPDWCISRQRLWGLPLPILVHKETRNPHPNLVALLEKVSDEVERKGAEAWWNLDLKELLGPEASSYEQEGGVLDVWFDSGSTHTTTSASELLQPEVWDLYLEGNDQYRGWFMSSLLTSVGIRKQAPYKQVVSHGFTVDQSGRKMSKSLGNVIAPSEIVQRYGAETLRVWAAAADYTSEVALSEEILRRCEEYKRKVRNTLRYLVANLSDFSAADQLTFDQLTGLDQWMLLRAKQVQQSVVEGYNLYNFQHVQRLLANFCISELSAFYLEVLKDRLYTTPAASKARRSAQTVLFQVAQGLARWVAPILAFTAEQAWTHLPAHLNSSSESVFLSQWWEFPEASEADLKIPAERWKVLLALRDQVLQTLELARTEGRVRNNLSAQIEVTVSDGLFKELKGLLEELPFFFLVSQVRVFAASEAEVPSSVRILPAEGEKCARCWMWAMSVLSSDGICSRCRLNLSGTDEEVRRWF